MGEEDKPTQAAGRRQSVPKAQYDDLLARFEQLKRDHEALKEGKSAENPLVNDLQAAPVITNDGVNNAGVQTVDVFASGAAGSDASPAAPGDLEAQLMNYRQAESLKAQNPGEAMKVYAQLARTAAPAIRARAQLRMGEMLMQQGEFDLAMQAFDEIVTRQAHSGVVLTALGHLVVCAEKLGLTQKKDQYQSLLRDVFQTGT